MEPGISQKNENQAGWSETLASRGQPKALLLESIHKTGVQRLKEAGFHVDVEAKALSEDELRHRLIQGRYQFLGIRSKTQVTSQVLDEAKNLEAIGCFCIGVNQVDLQAARLKGIAVFNAPFSNTRSVAELTIAEIILLARQLGDRSQEVHRGVWRKVSKGCFEVRGKILGIVGYGHIGSQVGVLAEAMGMRVQFFDVAAKLPLGNARVVSSLDVLLEKSDFVTLHVPETPQTRGMMGVSQIARMKKGSYLLNASRGSVVDLSALADAIRREDLAGAALDVYPEEPEGAAEDFRCDLQGLGNVVLTPHIGGSTEEAQANIGLEVGDSVVRFFQSGATAGAVNLPRLDQPQPSGTFRLINVHRNVPGVLKDINKIVSDYNANIHSQFLATEGEVGYLIMDLDPPAGEDVAKAMSLLKTSLKTRVLGVAGESA